VNRTSLKVTIFYRNYSLLPLKSTSRHYNFKSIRSYLPGLTLKFQQIISVNGNLLKVNRLFLNILDCYTEQHVNFVMKFAYKSGTIKNIVDSSWNCENSEHLYTWPRIGKLKNFAWPGPTGPLFFGNFAVAGPGLGFFWLRGWAISGPFFDQGAGSH
jgi:hypothetical protein